MATNKLEAPPVYVDAKTTPQDWHAAKIAARSLGMNGLPYESAVKAQMAMGGVIHPLELAATWQAYIERLGYRPRVIVDNRDHNEQVQRKQMHDAQQRAKEEAARKAPRKWRSLQEAAAFLSKSDYWKFCQSDEGKALMRRENL
jgi:hypothetical protein